MKPEEAIFGLMAQAEDLQTHALKLQALTEDTLKRLPGTVKEAIGSATGKASEDILEAAMTARAASSLLKSTGVLLGVFLLAVAIVVGGGVIATLKYVTSGMREELADLRQHIAVERSTLEGLQGKSWRLELINYGDGTRGIILPRGVKIDRTGPVKDGREAIVIKP